jgi:hypothetical protein
MSAVVDFPVKPEARAYLDAFTGVTGEPEWLARFRQQGLNRFAELGFPSRRSENWRYVDLQPLEKHPLLPSVMGQPMGVPAELALDGAGPRLVLVDGRFAPPISELTIPSPRSTPRSSPTASCSLFGPASCSTSRSRSSISLRGWAMRRCTRAP